MTIDDLMDVRRGINMQLHAMHQRAELGDREAAPRADGLRSAAMIVDALVKERYPDIWMTHEAPPGPAKEAMTEAELRSAVWAVLDAPDTSDEEKVLALRGFLRMTAVTNEAGGEE